eukprot:SAG31_NODE_10956_length_1079_cov_0.942857_1_plen_212_part_01
MDVNGNGMLSLAEVDKAVVELFPDFDHKPALMRAYKAADVSGDGLIRRNEFRLLLKYLVYFNDLWDRFDEIDSDDDRRVTLEEFKRGCGLLGIGIPADEIEADFNDMDVDGGGKVLFDEFCSWCARNHVIDDEGDEEDSDDDHATKGAGRNLQKPSRARRVLARQIGNKQNMGSPGSAGSPGSSGSPNRTKQSKRHLTRKNRAAQSEVVERL